MNYYGGKIGVQSLYGVNILVAVNYAITTTFYGIEFYFPVYYNIKSNFFILLNKA